MLQNGSVRKQFSGLLQFVTVCLDNLVHLAILLKFVRVYLNKIYKFGTCELVFTLILRVASCELSVASCELRVGFP